MLQGFKTFKGLKRFGATGCQPTLSAARPELGKGLSTMMMDVLYTITFVTQRRLLHLRGFRNIGSWQLRAASMNSSSPIQENDDERRPVRAVSA